MESDDSFDTNPSFQYTLNEDSSLVSFETDSISTSNIPVSTSTSSISELPAVLIETSKSKAWAHFTKDKNFKINKKSICNYCKAIYICSGDSTSNMSKHLEKSHPEKLNLLKNKSSIEKFFDVLKINTI